MFSDKILKKKHAEYENAEHEVYVCKQRLDEIMTSNKQNNNVS